MTGPMRFLDAVSHALDRTLERPADNEAEPVAILWPDESRQWEPLVLQLGESRPILTLGDYDAQSWTGPAYWLRCVIDGALPGPPPTGVPVVYLPGFSRSDVRAVEEAPAALKPLAELQYRGVIFAQLSGRDWTLAALLQASDARGGLGLALGSDDATKAALLRAREAIANVALADLRRNAPLRAAYFDGLLTPDIDKDVLRWLDDPATFTANAEGERWDAFCSAFQERFGLSVDAGAVTVAQQLGLQQTDAWTKVWRRFAESPSGYPNIPDRLRAARPKRVAEKPGLFDAVGSWPQENGEAEDELRAALVETASLEPDMARRRLLELEQIHGRRREWVWGTLGNAPLAKAVRWLAVVAEASRRNVPDAGLEDIVATYIGDAWRTDDALVRALAAVETEADREAVGFAASTVYRPWLEVGAERMVRASHPELGRIRCSAPRQLVHGNVRHLHRWPALRHRKTPRGGAGGQRHPDGTRDSPGGTPNHHAHWQACRITGGAAARTGSAPGGGWAGWQCGADRQGSAGSHRVRRIPDPRP